MIWVPEPWQGLTLSLIVGILLVLLGSIPLLPQYQSSKQFDPSHWLSYLGSFILGITVIILALIQYF